MISKWWSNWTNSKNSLLTNLYKLLLYLKRNPNSSNKCPNGRPNNTSLFRFSNLPKRVLPSLIALNVKGFLKICLPTGLLRGKIGRFWAKVCWSWTWILLKMFLKGILNISPINIPYLRIFSIGWKLSADWMVGAVLGISSPRLVFLNRIPPFIKNRWKILIKILYRLALWYQILWSNILNLCIRYRP